MQHRVAQECERPGSLEHITQFTGTVERSSDQALPQVEVRRVAAPLRLPSAAECVRFERESFGALHQMLAGLDAAERETTWRAIAQELAQYEGSSGFEGPCELLVCVGVKAAR